MGSQKNDKYGKRTGAYVCALDLMNGSPILDDCQMTYEASKRFAEFFLKNH